MPARPRRSQFRAGDGHQALLCGRLFYRHLVDRRLAGGRREGLAHGRADHAGNAWWSRKGAMLAALCDCACYLPHPSPITMATRKSQANSLTPPPTKRMLRFAYANQARPR